MRTDHEIQGIGQPLATRTPTTALPAVVAPLPKPRKFDPDVLFSTPVTSLLTVGIFNPLGPSVDAMVAVGDLKSAPRLPVVRVLLNPFSRGLEQIGTLLVGDGLITLETLRPLFSLPRGDCPTLLCPLKSMSATDAITVYAELLTHFSGVTRTLTLVRQHLGKPWDRASAELQDASTGDATPTTAHDARALATLLLSDEHARPEIRALVGGWQGALEQVFGPIVPGHLMSHVEFARVFQHLTESCRLPALHE